MDHINALDRKGCSTKCQEGAGGDDLPPRLEIVHVPDLRHGACRYSELIEQQPDGFIAVDVFALGVSKEAPDVRHPRAGRLDGQRANILDGDLAVFEADCEPCPGKIVAALIDGETTLKTIRPEAWQAFLHAENPRYPDLIPAQELLIQGVLVHLQRNLDGCETVRDEEEI